MDNVIISVGYRVKSLQSARFRRWVTDVLRQHLFQGYSINQERFETARSRPERKDVRDKPSRLDAAYNRGIFSLKASPSHFLFGESDQSHGSEGLRSTYVPVVDTLRFSFGRALRNSTFAALRDSNITRLNPALTAILVSPHIAVLCGFHAAKII